MQTVHSPTFNGTKPSPRTLLKHMLCGFNRNSGLFKTYSLLLLTTTAPSTTTSCRPFHSNFTAAQRPKKLPFPKQYYFSRTVLLLISDPHTANHCRSYSVPRRSHHCNMSNTLLINTLLYNLHTPHNERIPLELPDSNKSHSRLGQLLQSHIKNQIKNYNSFNKTIMLILKVDERQI